MDIALQLDAQGRFDLAITGGGLAVDQSLATAVAVSLFSDRRALPGESLPAGETWRRGWWAGGLVSAGLDTWGSGLWLLSREKQTEEVRLRAEEYAREALKWLVGDGIAQSLTVSATWLGRGLLGLAVEIQRASGVEAYTFERAWSVQGV